MRPEDQNFYRLLAEAARVAPSADNSQPASLVFTGDELILRHRHGSTGDHGPGPADPATLLGIGTTIENIAAAAEQMGVTLQLTLDGEDTVYGRFTAQGPLPGTASLERDHPLFQRHTNRHAYQKRQLPEEVLASLRAMREEHAHLLALESREARRALAETVKRATEIRFRVKETHEWLAASLRYSEAEVERGDGLDVRTLNLPPGGSLFLRLTASWQRMQFLNRLGIYKLMAAMDAAPLSSAPAVLALQAPADWRGALTAGRLLCRCWSYLNAEGLAVHPYYVITDQLYRAETGLLPAEFAEQAAAIEEETRRVCEIESGNRLYILLRVGYPKREARHARRLPISEIYSDTSENSPGVAP